MPIFSRLVDLNDDTSRVVPQASQVSASMYARRPANNENDRVLRSFTVVYSKLSTRIHKKWDFDGTLECKGVNGTRLYLKNDKGQHVASTSSYSPADVAALGPRSRVAIGGYEAEIVENEDSMQSEPGTTPWLQSASPASALPSYATPAPNYRNSVASINHGILEPPPSKVHRQYVSPFANKSQQGDHQPAFELNPDREPSEAVVVVDRRISQHLRDHQKEGVRFLYEKLKSDGGGAILADDMGLGKSVQTVSLIHSLTKQGPKGLPLIYKCLLVVPCTLTKNWCAEFRKWIPLRTPCYEARTESDISNYVARAGTFPTLIISYELALRNIERLSRITFDLLVCDEAHRLKNKDGTLRTKLHSLGIGRRLLLTGTPLQNDLDEFFSLLDFVRPGAFGTVTGFRAMADGSGHNVEKLDLIADCMLRRTADVNKAYLPPKVEYLVFCKPSELQLLVYATLLDNITVDGLVLIDLLRKLCNHPALLLETLSEMQERSTKGRSFNFLDVLRRFPPDYGPNNRQVADSGKLTVLCDMILSFRDADERAVVVSQYTKTLDMIEQLFFALGFSILRLDGQTPPDERQKLVDRFNRSNDANQVFLLSAKAGGVGLNLIGASRMVLYDSDWNPANDLQATARIWRDGQHKECHVFRLVTTRTIDEKILQRQIKKTGLSSIVDVELLTSVKNVKFTDADLRDIFTIASSTDCQTHDLSECTCKGNGLLSQERTEDPDDTLDEPDEGQIEESLEQDAGRSHIILDDDDETWPVEEADMELDKTASLSELSRWRHYSTSSPLQFRYLQSKATIHRCSADSISFVMLQDVNY